MKIWVSESYHSILFAWSWRVKIVGLRWCFDLHIYATVNDAGVIFGFTVIPTTGPHLISRCLWCDYLHPMVTTLRQVSIFFFVTTCFHSNSQSGVGCFFSFANPNQPEITASLQKLKLNPAIIKSIQKYPIPSSKSSKISKNHPKSAKPATLSNKFMRIIQQPLRCRSAFDALNITVRWVYLKVPRSRSTTFTDLYHINTRCGRASARLRLLNFFRLIWFQLISCEDFELSIMIKTDY